MLYAERNWRIAYCTTMIDETTHRTAVETLKLICESPNPGSIPDMKIGDFLEKVKDIEKMQHERKDSAERLEKVEALLVKFSKLIKSSQSRLDSSNIDHAGKIDRLDKLEEFTKQMNSKLQLAKKKLQKPGVQETIEAGNAIKAVWNYFNENVLKHARALSTDADIGQGWTQMMSQAEGVFDMIGKLPLMATITGMGKDVATVGKWIGKGLGTLKNKLWGGEPPEDAMEDVIDQVAQRKDIKWKTAPFMSLFNIDPEYQAMLDDDLEIKFIKAFKSFLEGQIDQNAKMNTLDIDDYLERWIPAQDSYKDHTVDINQ